MLPSLVVGLLLAAPPNFHLPIKVALTEFSGAGLPREESELYAEHLATQLSGRGLTVTTAKQIATVLGLERQKQLVGCSDSSSSCFAELANALGVDGILMGEVGHLDGNNYQVSVRVLDATTGKPLAQSAGRVAGKGAVVDELTWAAKRLSATLAAQLKRILPTPTDPVVSSEELARHPLRGAAWLPAVAALGFAAGSGTLFLFSDQRYTALASAQGTLFGSEARKLRDEGAQLQLLSAASLGAFAAGVGIAGFLYFFRVEPKDSYAPTVMLAPTANGIALSGVLP